MPLIPVMERDNRYMVWLLRVVHTSVIEHPNEKKYLSGALGFFSQPFRDNNEKLYLNIIYENLTRM